MPSGYMAVGAYAVRARAGTATLGGGVPPLPEPRLPLEVPLVPLVAKEPLPDVPLVAAHDSAGHAGGNATTTGVVVATTTTSPASGMSSTRSVLWLPETLLIWCWAQRRSARLVEHAISRVPLGYPNLCKVSKLLVQRADHRNRHERRCLGRSRVCADAGEIIRERYHMSKRREPGEKIDPRTGRSRVRFYVWGFGRQDKARRRRIMCGESAESVREACRRQGFTIYRIALAPAPLPDRPSHGPQETGAGSDRTLSHRTVMGVRATSVLSDVFGD